MNLYERLQEIREANDKHDSFTVRELLMKLQRDITIGEVTVKDEPSFAETGDDHLSEPCIRCGKPINGHPSTFRSCCVSEEVKT